MENVKYIQEQQPSVSDAVQVFPSVGPELAARWLSRLHPNQRRVRQAHVKAIAAAMEQGLFRWTGDPIRFDAEGRLIDGQHRLQAVLLSGCPMINVVVVTVEGDDAAQYIDQQIAVRTARDAASFMGYKPPPTSVLSAVLLDLHDFDTNNYRSLQKPERVRMVIGHRFYEAAWRIHAAADSQRILPTGALAAALRCMRVAPDEAEQFFTNVATNNHVGPSAHYTRTFTNFLIRERTDRSRAVGSGDNRQRSKRMADRAIRCWNAYRTHARYTKVMAGTGDRVPAPV